MTDQTNDVLELTEAYAAPEEKQKPSVLKTIATELLFAGGRATATTANMGVGAMTGLLSAGAFGLTAEFVNSVAANTPAEPGFAFCLGAAFNAPFIHHIFKGKLPELAGTPNPDGAFTKATKASAYVAGAIGAFMAAASLMSAPDDGIGVQYKDEPFERHPSQMHEAKNKMTVARADSGAPVFVMKG